MADRDEQCRKGFDPLTLLAGLATLLVSGYVLSDGALWFPTLDLRWLLAGSAVVVGLVLLAASVRGRKR